MRVIAGRLRGRSFDAPAGMRTRPTIDRVREALFSILGNLEGKRVADLYAGSGAMGIEALSRGAAHVTFVESSRPAVIMIVANLDSLGLRETATVVARPVERAREALSRRAPYDVVIADPPWTRAARAALDVGRLVRSLLSPGARVVLGHRASEPIDLPARSGLVVMDRRSWGDSGMTFLEIAG